MGIKRVLNSRLAAVGAGAAVLAVLAGGAGFAAGQINSGDIQNDSIRGADIKDGNLKLKEFHRSAITGLKGEDGARGPAGPAGPEGPQGPAGAPGDAQTPVTELSGDWVVTEDDCGSGNGVVADAQIVEGKLEFSEITNGTARARVDFAPLVGMTLADLATFEYSASYTQEGSDGVQGMPYFIVKIEDGPDADSAEDSVVFNPSSQPDGQAPLKAGVWQHWSVTDGQGRFNDDPGAGPDQPWQDIVREHGDRPILRAGIQAGCAGTQIGVTSKVDNVVIDIQGEKSEFNFSS
jgi:hypothetical protein